VREFDPFLVGHEHDGVVADRRAAAQGVDADLAARTFAGHAVAAVAGDRLEVDAASFGQRLGEPKRGAARRVFFEAVVHFDNLGVIVGTEDRGRTAHELEQQVYAQAHVGRPDDRYLAGSRVDALLLGVCQAGGAQHEGLAVLNRVRKMVDDRGVKGEVDHGVGLSRPLVGIAERVRDGFDVQHAADRFHARADRRMARALGGRDNRAAVELAGTAQQVLAHAARRA